MSNNLKEGVYKISHENYHADPCIEPSLSRSIIMDLLFKSPLHAWSNHPRLNPDYREQENGKFDLGKAAHSLFLEGMDNTEIIEADDWRTKAAKEAREEARKNGKVPLLSKEFDQANNIVAKAMIALEKSELKGLFDDGDAELTYIWQDGPSWCRVRPDKISKDRKYVLDFKTTSASANPDDFVRMILSKGYDVQSSFYRRGVKAFDGTDPKFIFLVIEIDPPYACSFISLSPEFEVLGASKVVRGMDLWRTCTAKNEWPSYPSRICYLDPPPWAMNWEMRATFIGNSFEEV